MWLCPSTSLVGQQSIHSINKLQHTKCHQIPTCTTAYASTQCRRTRYTNTEEPFHCGHVQHALAVPHSPMGLPFTTDHPHLKPCVSAYTMLKGNFDFNKTPMTPQAQESLFMRNWRNAYPGILMAPTGVISAKPTNSIAIIACTPPRPRRNTSLMEGQTWIQRSN